MAPLGGRKVGDMCMFDSDFFLSCDYVNLFADEAKKQTWGIFEETGIFACACHHGMILWIVDIVCSSELYVTLHKEASSADFNVGLSIRSPS
jgi:hypothetical protein